MKINIIKWFAWVATGCPMYIGAISATTATLIGAGVTAASTGASILAGKTGAKGIKGPSDEAINASLTAQQQAYVDSLNASNQGAEEQNRLQQEAYDSIRGYQQPYADIGARGNQLLGEYLGTPAQEARATATGVPPEELARLQAEMQARQTGLASATERANALKAQLGKLQYSPQTAPMIKAIQEQYNQALRDQQAIQSQFDAANTAFKTAQATPYLPAQEARDAVPGQLQQNFGTPNEAASYDYTISRAKNITSDEINKWLGDHPELDDEGIMKAMRDSGVSIDQLAQATGTPASEINKRISTVTDRLNPYNQRATPKFTPYGEPIPEYKKLTEAEMIANDPGYAFRLAQGNKALENKALASGKFFSGETAKALTDYGQNYASNEFANADARNTNNFLQSLTQWGTGNTKNTQDFQTESGSWLNDYNAFVNDQDRLFNKITGISKIGQETANTLSNAAGNYAGNVGNNIGTQTSQNINAYNNLGDAVANITSGADLGNRQADAAKGVIGANTISNAATNAITGANLIDWSGIGIKNKVGTGGSPSTISNAQSFLPQQGTTPGGFWGGNTLRTF